MDNDKNGKFENKYFYYLQPKYRTPKASDKRIIKNAQFMLRLQIVIYDGIWYISM